MTATAIYKQTLEPGATVIKGYLNARPVSVGLDPSGVPCVWFEQQGAGGFVDVELMTVGTGHEFSPSSGWLFLGTFVLAADGLVLHVYWRARRR